MSKKEVLWDQVIIALDELRRLDLTDVERQALRQCRSAVGDVIIEQEVGS